MILHYQVKREWINFDQTRSLWQQSFFLVLAELNENIQLGNFRMRYLLWEWGAKECHDIAHNSIWGLLNWRDGTFSSSSVWAQQCTWSSNSNGFPWGIHTHWPRSGGQYEFLYEFHTDCLTMFCPITSCCYLESNNAVSGIDSCFLCAGSNSCWFSF